jgi:hypothetical protein
VLGIVRDPRDFVLSAKKRAGQAPESSIEDYNLTARLFLELLESHAQRFTIVRFADLVTRPREIVARCCSFAGIDLDERMLEPSSWSGRGRQEYPRDGFVDQVKKWRGAEGQDRLIVEQADRACFPAAGALGYLRMGNLS